MAMAGFSMNIYEWNRTGNYYAGLKEKYRGLADPLAVRIQELDSRASGYEKSISRIDSLLKNDSLGQGERDGLAAQRRALSVLDGSVDTAGALARRDQAYLGARQAQNDDQEKNYYSDRNQNVWYLLAVYFYAAFDAYVDAHLSGFERRMDFSLAPRADGLAFNVNYHLK
jgi:hypothetical protein